MPRSERVELKMIRGSLEYLVVLFLSILCAPLMAVIAIAIKLDSPGPVFFIQPRAGKNGRIFNMIKFRSMRVHSGKELIQESDKRISRWGHFLRKSSLDEIPQFFNILKGEMRVIGPRAALPEQAQHYSAFQRKRLTVKPGLTGMVAVCGGHLLTWPQRIRWDVWYVRHQSFWLDLWIAWKTVLLLITGRPLVGKNGISEEFTKKHA
ncbi:MAG: sugar transferase [Candidatus Omnitrophica bacterium]|nr:sugar transferase [Candidatus Omnitrophota bacterium]